MAVLDTVDRVKLGERLRLARTARGLTQEQAAASVKVARTTMVAIERGERAVRAEELVALSELYGVTVSALLRPASVHVELVGHFRTSGSTPAAEAHGQEALRTLQSLASGAAELERQLERPLVTDYPPERVLGRGSLWQQAEDAASDFRQRYGLGLAPIVDIVSLAELEVGMRVFIRRLPSVVGGVFAFHPELGACMLLNANHPRTRRAFTAAHEAGHLLTERNVPDVVYIESGPKQPSERFADAFASCLLMPGSLVRRAFAEYERGDGRFSPRHLILLAHRLHVSPEAMCRRLEQLNLLPRGTYESLRSRGLSENTVRDVLGDPATEALPPVPPRLAVLAAEAIERDLFTEGQLCEMLSLDRVEFREVMDHVQGGVPADAAEAPGE